MAEKAKIMILSTAYLPHIGGSELAIKNITDRMKDFEFHLVTARINKDDSKREKMGNVLAHRVGNFLSVPRLFLPKITLPLFIFLKVRKLMKKNDYELIHAFQASQAAGAAWFLKVFGSRVPLVLTLQEGKDLDKQSLLVKFLRGLIIKRADYATAISEYLKDYVLRIKSDIPVAVIPNGVDIENFSNEFSYNGLVAVKEKLGIKPEEKIIITVSRLVEKNGVDLLIEAIQNVRCQMSNIKCLIVGEGPLLESLKFKVRSLKLEDRVIFVGSVKNEDLPVYLKISDVFVRPSRSEGLGSAFIEAMAAGVPIIGTNVGGIQDFLEDGKTGLFCSLNSKDIASKIKLVLENSELRQKITGNASVLAREKYDWDKIAEKYKEVYSLSSS